MRTAALLLMTLLLAPRAFALTGAECEARLAGKPVPKEVQEVFTSLRAAGVNSLLEEIYSGKATVSMRGKWLPFQPPVSARVSGWTGRKTLVIREVHVRTPQEKQKFTWDVALALFELQMQPWLWSRQSMLSSGAASTALNADEDDDALGYFALQMPQEWRDQYLERANVMLRELYALFLTLPDLRAEDLMAADDPGRAWILSALFMQNGAHAIAPNLKDFEILKRKGAAALESSVTKTNSRSVLFNYYMNHVKRMLIATFVVSNLAIVPHLAEIPSYIEAQREWSQYQQTLNTAPTRAQETELKTIEHRRQREIRRLTAEIERQEAMPARDEAAIDALRSALQENIERSAGSVYSGDPTKPGVP